MPGFTASFDLESQEFVRSPEAHLITVFPLRWVYDTTRLLDFRTALRSHPRADELNRQFDSVYGAITNYQIPVVTLKDLTVEEVCPIFERINSSGTRLSTYDLMVAATWSTSFDLNEEASEIKDALGSKGFSDIEGDTILKCLAAIKNRSIKREDVVALRRLSKEEMRALAESTKEALLKTVDLLTTEFKIYSWDFLPYEALAIVICYVFSKTKILDAEQILRVRKWFWRSAFNERYRGASEHFVSRDLQAIHSYVVEGKGDADEFGRKPDQGIWRTIAFRSNNSRSRAFVLALALHGPRNLTNGVAIDTANALSIYNQKEFHHIYPRAHLKAIVAPGEHNALGNFCMLAASENRAISDSNPNTYLPECIKILGVEAARTFESNLLPTPDKFPYEGASYAEFIEARTTVIDNVVSRLCDGRAG
jgi:hypothetical protein